MAKRSNQLDNDTSHPFYVWSGLLTPKHIKAIGPALAEFLWCINRTTIEVDGIGYVLGGKAVTYDEISEELGIPNATVRRHLALLKSEGYVLIERDPAGVRIMVINSKKRPVRLLKNEQSDCSKMSNRVSKNEQSECSKMSNRLLKNEQSYSHDKVQTKHEDKTETKQEDESSYVLISVDDVRKAFFAEIYPTGKNYEGGMNCTISQAIEYACDDYGTEAVRGAIREVAISGKKSWGMVVKVLKDAAVNNDLDRLDGTQKGDEVDYSSYTRDEIVISNED